MSDEQKPFSLRLKPRTRPTESSPEAGQEPTAGDSPAGGDAAGGLDLTRLRIRPRPAPGTEQPLETPSEDSPGAPTEPEPALSEATTEELPIDPPIAPLAESPLQTTETSEESPKPAAPVVGGFRIVPGVKLLDETDSVKPLSHIPFPVPPTVTASPGPVRSTAGDFVHPEESRAFRTGLWAVVGIVVLILGGLAFLGYRFVSKHNTDKPIVAETAVAPEKAAPAPTAEPASVHKEVPAPSKLPAGGLVAEHPVSMPGKLIAKARDTVADYNASEQVTSMNQALGVTPAPAAKTTPPPPTKAPTPLPAVNLADNPGPQSEDAPTPSAALRAFVINLKVNGVFQGSPARALLNGKMAQVGDEIEGSKGIVLVNVDPSKKLLTFREASGATMNRRY